jgi:nitrate/nitrite transport system permease protein
MALVEDTTSPAPMAMRQRLGAALERVERMLTPIGFGKIAPVLRLAAGDRPALQLKEIWQGVGVPVLAIVCFLALWGALAPRVQTSLGAVPGPAEVWEQSKTLWADHLGERAREVAYYERQEKRIGEALAKDPNAEVRRRTYSGRPTFIDQICTSLKTVFTGFVLASLVRHPVRPFLDVQRWAQPHHPDLQAGLAASLAADRHHGRLRALHPGAARHAEELRDLGDHGDAVLAVADADQHRRRGELHRSRPRQRRARLEALLVHQGVQGRAALGVAADLHGAPAVAGRRLDGADRGRDAGAEPRPWEVRVGEFQNGSSNSLARIMVAVLTIGIIGFLLDRLMVALQSAFTHSAAR